MKNYDFGRDAKTVDRGRESCTGAEKGGWKAGRRFFLIIPHGFLVLLLAGTVMASCLNPVGFMPDLKSFPGSAVGQDKPGDQDAQKPGNVSPPDTPILHPESDRGVIVFKNLSGGAKGLSAVFTISGQKSGISASLPLGPGQEKSITLFPDTYYVAITFEGQGSPITGSKVLLPGRVEYAYFYVDKNGNYKGGINTDSSFVYGDINYSYYADNENNGDNRDSNNVAKPEEGDVSLENNPRNKLPANMRENYGLVLIHNISNTMPLLKLTFDHALPDKTAVHWEMNPGPDKGTQKSIVLRPGAWQVRSIWIDPADPNCAGGLITTDVKKVGASGYINHLYFYKAVDGKWYLTDKEDSRQWSPPVENKDYNSGGVGQDNQSTVSLAGEGQYTNENGVINTNHAWWDTNDGRNNFGILAVKNLSSRSRITKVGLEYASDSKRKYEMGPIGARNDMSVILGKGDWKITVHYTTGGISYTKTLTKNVQALGLTNRLNFAYFYYTNKSGYNVSADQSPPDYDNDAGGSTNPGEKEGDSPGALTDGNRGTLGLLILKNLSSDTNVDIARAAANFTAVPLSYTMNPGPNSKDQKSILLQAGEWSASASYYPVNAQTAVSTPSKNIQIAPGQVSYMYFYKNRGGAFELSLSWPPVPNNAAPENADPGTIISENEGWLRIINKSMVSTIDRVQYNNGGAWIDIAIPSASIAPGYTSDPDLVVLKGSWSFRFKIATKPTYSQAVSKTVKAGETAALEYSDALDSDLPPAGFGTLRIVNNSPHMIVKLVTQTRNSAGVYESKTQAIPTINPKGQSGSTQIQVLSAGGAGQSRDYIVQCYTDDNTFYEETALIRDGRITSVIVKDTSSQVVVDQHNPDPNLTHGGLLVINKYSGPLSFKIFRIFLYKKLPNNSYGDNYVAPDSGLYQKDYPGIPAASAQVFNGTVYNKDDYLLAGQSRNFASLEQGTYRLFIFAGSYNWDYYEDNNMVGSIPMNWKRITYDCGDLFITAKSRKVYNFDPYIAGVNDRDTPHGMVKLVLNNGGSTTGSGYSGTLTQVQIISGSTISGKITETSPAYVLDISRPTPTDPTLQSSATDVDKGGPENRTSGGFVPPRYVVIDRAEPLTPGNSLTFFVPPGIYGMRVFNPQGGGPEDAWYGRKSDRYLDLYLVEESSKTIVINWYQPHGLQIITSTSGIAYKQVTDLNLSGALKAPAVGHPLQPRIEQGAYSQYYSADIRWYYSTGIQGPITDHYWLPDSPSHVRSPSPIQYPHFISDITTHNVKVGDYYSAVVTLIPESGYTYAGLRPSTEGSGNIKTTGTSPFAYNNYPLRSMGWWLSSWLATDGALKNEAAQKDGSIKVVIHFPILR